MSQENLYGILRTCSSKVPSAKIETELATGIVLILRRQFACILTLLLFSVRPGTRWRTMIPTNRSASASARLPSRHFPFATSSSSHFRPCLYRSVQTHEKVGVFDRKLGSLRVTRGLSNDSTTTKVSGGELCRKMHFSPRDPLPSMPRRQPHFDKILIANRLALRLLHSLLSSGSRRFIMQRRDCMSCHSHRAESGD
jgi:hypothetical protein